MDISPLLKYLFVSSNTEKLKPTIVILFLSLVGFPIWAQIGIRNLSLIQPDTNVLYSGLDNVIEIYGIQGYKLEFTSTNFSGYYILDSDSTFEDSDEPPELFKLDYLHDNPIIIRPTKGEILDTLIVKTKGKILYQKIYKVLPVDGPKLYIAGTFKSIISKDQLLSNPRFSLFPEDNLYKLKIIISSIDIYIQKYDSSSVELINTSGDFSTEFMEIITTLQSGDIIYFDNVKVIGPDYKLRNIGGRRITIR